MSSSITDSASSPSTTNMGDAIIPFATVNVKSHVPVTLELRAGNYTKWSTYFKAMCGKFGLLKHIDGTAAPAAPDDTWIQTDCCVRSWLYGSVSESVLDFAMAPDQTARQLWVAIDAHFTANRAPRCIYLSHEFHNINQGDLSVEDYGQKVKQAADRLRDAGEQVAESTLVLNLLRGANPKFSTTCDFIAGTPGMTFATALDQLALKELRLAHGASVTANTALVASPSSTGCGSACRLSSAPSGVPQQQQQRRPRKKRNGGGGGAQQGGGGGGYQQGGQAARPPYPTGPWLCFNPWAAQLGGQAGAWTGQGASYRGAPFTTGGWSGQGLLGSAPQQAHTAFAPSQFSQAPAPSWDQAGLVAALQQMSLQGSSPWVMDTGATTHMHSSEGILFSRTPSPHSSIVVGNGTSIPVTSRGQSFLPTIASNFVLNNVLVVPSIVRNLLSVRQFTRDNSCSVEFDAFGFSVKDLRTRRVILRCNSDGDLYTITATAPATAHALLAASTSLWHQRLGHPSPATVSSLRQNKHITCTKSDRSLCHACQLGKHTRLPFSTSTSRTSSPFELVHCDVWTSPVPSISGYSYYLVMLDDFTHYCWTFPLHHKSDVHEYIVQFISYAHTQFSLPIKCFQTDNGREFINIATTALLASRGILFRHSCPYTSPQNGKAERVLHTLNSFVRTLNNSST